MTKPLHSITVRRLIPACRERVFDAFSRSDALAQWFTPRPDVAVEVLAFEFVPQGSFRLRYTMPDGAHKLVGGAYELIAPPDRLAFSWIWEPPDPHAGIPTRVLVRFLEQGDATEVVMTHDRLPSKESCPRYVTGWEGTLANLDAVLAGGESPASTIIGDTPHARG